MGRSRWNAFHCLRCHPAVANLQQESREMVEIKWREGGRAQRGRARGQDGMNERYLILLHGHTGMVYRQGIFPGQIFKNLSGLQLIHSK